MLTVDTIENGTVVDHIKPGMGKKVLDLMGIDQNYPHRVALMINVPSKKSGKKDILKIEGILVSDEKTNLIALVSPKATVNHIQGGKVVKKNHAELPEKIFGAGKCPNPKCISNSEKVPTRFTAEPGDGYRCGYCERRFGAGELV